ncbi:MAG: hypothetical protein J6S21_05540, partial [Victivallales bacterium]|nr:hypothetical protein [Victivallales bacterium]
TDNGNSWKRGKDLENTPVAEEKHHVNAIEYSYPTVIAADERNFAVVYTKRENSHAISFCLGQIDELV